MAVFGASTRKMTSSEALQRHFSASVDMLYPRKSGKIKKYLHPISRQSEELNLHLHTLALGTTTLTATSHSWQHANALSWITPGISLGRHPRWYGCLSVWPLVRQIIQIQEAGGSSLRPAVVSFSPHRVSLVFCESFSLQR